MPPVSSNDNQGLKIAVAIFATLTLLLAIATYLGFSEASKNAERYEAAQKAEQNAKSVQNELQNRFNELLELSGYSKTDPTVVKDAIAKDMQALSGKVAGIPAAAQQFLAQTAPGGPQAGLTQQAFDQLKASAESLANEPNKTLLATLTRISDLLEIQSRLMAAYADDYEATRKELEKTNQVNQEKLKVEVDAKEAAIADAQAELAKHEEERKSLIGRNDDLQNRNQQLANEKTDLEARLAQLREDSEARISQLRTQLASVREQMQANYNQLESPNGFITYVDNNRDEVHTSLTRRQGAREQMIFTVFDRNAVGIPSDRPKARIELIQVTDTGSIGRVLERLDRLSPLQIRDQIYSPAFDTRPRQFALIGKIDIDRDGRDDRNDLKRMIEAAGGEIVYDLPPAGKGQEQGEITPLTSWYVLDTEPPLRPGTEEQTGATVEEVQEFETKRTKALSEARASGVQPINLQRLLSMLNYRYGQPNVGHTEAVNRRAIEQLTNPRGIRPPANGNGSVPPADDGDVIPDADDANSGR